MKNVKGKNKMGAERSSFLPFTFFISPSSFLPVSYLLYFTAAGLFAPYFPIYLRERGLATVHIGWLLAAGPLMRILFPPLVGFAADARGGPAIWSRVVAWGALAGLLVATLGATVGTLVTGTLIYYVFVASIIPLLDAAALRATEHSRTTFGRVRLWGSIGFLLTSGALGLLYPLLPAAVIAASLIAAHLSFALFIILPHGARPAARNTRRASLPADTERTSLDMGGADDLHDTGGVATRQTGVIASPAEPVGVRGGWRDVRGLWRDPALWLLLSTLFLNRLASAPFNGFYTIFVRELGHGGDTVAWSWALGVGTEILLMLVIDRVIARFGFSLILTAGVALEAVRWFVFALTTSAEALLLIAPLHGIAFTMLYVASVHGLARTVPARLQAFGQAAGAAATGFGQMAGFIAAGYLHDALGNSAMFFAAGCAGVLATVNAALLNKSTLNAGR